ncbi:hypothetical protein B296_00017652 [Ensete ventricosum]|uniref:Uncharacterized protein n=1 Tax=Ensete ventricosum TaxID=4639 RepID=A0A426Z9B5_ENSVE|nr:hypothetical protein B296_00017652 [Ensete ventricosum]
MGGTYQSAKLLVRGPVVIWWYRQNRPSAVDFSCSQSIEGEIDHRRSIEGEKGKKKKKKRKRRRRGKEERRRRGEEERSTSLPARCRCPRPRAIFLLREDGCLPTRGERSR